MITTWGMVVPGEIVTTNGTEWEIVSRSGDEITIKRLRDGKLQTGSPPPSKPVTIVSKISPAQAVETIRDVLGGHVQ